MPYPESPVAQSKGTIIDSHAHVVKQYFPEDQQVVIERALAAGVAQMVNPGVDLQSIPEIIELSCKYNHIFVGVGLHPHEAELWDDTARDTIARAAEQPKVVAIGECGLDFHYDDSSRASQIESFKAQIHLARHYGKPIIVHCRDAWQEALALLQTEGRGELRGVFHCFTGGPEVMSRIEALDFYISFSGIVTYPNARDIQAAARQVRNERIMVETDCPYLAPQNVRGKRNEPSYVWQVAEKLAELRGTTLDAIAATTSANARALFNIPAD